MRLTLIAAAALMIAAAMPALAEDRCTVPEADWRPVEELKANLSAKGWTISNVKTEDGCYEVYGFDQDNKRAEVFFNPRTFEKVGEERK